jgi:hypothetical protein
MLLHLDILSAQVVLVVHPRFMFRTLLGRLRILFLFCPEPGVAAVKGIAARPRPYDDGSLAAYAVGDEGA